MINLDLLLRHQHSNYHPVYAFNGLYRRGYSGQWATMGETRDFWLQIKCPDLVRLWRISLRGLDSDRHIIYRWKLEGSIDGITFTVLYEAPNPTFLGNEIYKILSD